MAWGGGFGTAGRKPGTVIPTLRLHSFCFYAIQPYRASDEQRVAGYRRRRHAHVLGRKLVLSEKLKFGSRAHEVSDAIFIQAKDLPVVRPWARREMQTFRQALSVI